MGYALAYQGEARAARAAAEAALEAGAELGEMFVGMGYLVLALAALAAGDGARGAGRERGGMAAPGCAAETAQCARL